MTLSEAMGRLRKAGLLCDLVSPNHILGGTRYLDIPNIRGFEQGFGIFLEYNTKSPKWVVGSHIEPGMPEYEEESLDLAVDRVLRIYRERGRIPPET